MNPTAGGRADRTEIGNWQFSKLETPQFSKFKLRPQLELRFLFPLSVFPKNLLDISDESFKSFPSADGRSADAPAYYNFTVVQYHGQSPSVENLLLKIRF
eukprot:5518212-Pyramimonas_sp.AAC.1